MVEENKVIKRFKSFILGKCNCGCNEDISIRTIRGYVRRYKNFHSNKLGNNHFWIKGEYTDKKGYTHVLKWDHPQHDNNGYVLKHRFIYEEYHGCCLLPWIEIHHIVPINKGGTDDVSNLLPVTTSEHMMIHKKVDLSDRFCVICNSNITYKYKNHNPIWRKYKEGYSCLSCYVKTPEFRLYNKIKCRRYREKISRTVLNQ